MSPGALAVHVRRAANRQDDRGRGGGGEHDRPLPNARCRPSPSVPKSWGRACAETTAEDVAVLVQLSVSLDGTGFNWTNFTEVFQYAFLGANAGDGRSGWTIGDNNGVHRQCPAGARRGGLCGLLSRAAPLHAVSHWHQARPRAAPISAPMFTPGGSSCVKDCAGVFLGSATLDDCNVCSGGLSGHVANRCREPLLLAPRCRAPTDLPARSAVIWTAPACVSGRTTRLRALWVPRGCGVRAVAEPHAVRVCRPEGAVRGRAHVQGRGCARGRGFGRRSQLPPACRRRWESPLSLRSSQS
jgi:hypothetical protein